MHEASFGSFVAAIPPPLGIGTLTLADGRAVKRFLCETYATESAENITAFGVGAPASPPSLRSERAEPPNSPEQHQKS
jgi:hypothetical protein